MTAVLAGRFVDGFWLSLDGSWIDNHPSRDGVPSWDYSLDAIGERAQAWLDPLAIRIEDARGEIVDALPKETKSDVSFPPSVAALIGDVVAAIREGRPPLVTGDQALMSSMSSMPSMPPPISAMRSRSRTDRTREANGSVLAVFGVPPRSRGEDHPLIRAVGIAWVLENDYHDHDDHDGDVSGMTTDIWTVAEAKARLSEVIEQATANGPQTITKRGRTAVVVVSAEEWDRKTRRKGNLAEFFAASPLRGSGLSIARKKDRPRKVEL